MNKLLAILPFLSTASLFAQGNGGERGGNFMNTIIMIAVFILFFYFILFRPEQKRRKAAEKLRRELKQGDRATAMGIIGTVDKIQDTTVILKMVDGSKIEVVKAAITEVQPSGTQVETKEEPKS